MLKAIPITQSKSVNSPPLALWIILGSPKVRAIVDVNS